jgi:transposase InsO family protein
VLFLQGGPGRRGGRGLAVGAGHRRGVRPEGNRVAQYTSIAYAERLSEAGIDASIGTTGDSYDKGLAS